MESQYQRLSQSERMELYNGEATRLYKRWMAGLIDARQYRQQMTELATRLGL